MSEKDLTFQLPLTCQAHEVAVSDTLNLQQTNHEEQVGVKSERVEACSIDRMLGLPVRETCFKCGRSHQPRDCPFMNAECFASGKLGHLAKVCRSKLRNQSKHANVVEKAEDLSESTHMLFNLRSLRVPPIVLHVAVNGQEVPMELDTSASVSIVTKQVWEMMQSPRPVLRPSVIKLHTYTEETICCLGKISVSLGYNQQQHAHLPTGGFEGRGTMSAGKRLAPTLQSILARCAPHHSTQSSN